MLWRDDSQTIKAVANLPNYTERVEPLKKAGILYIDDLFKTQSGREPSAADIHLAFEIINYRYINSMPTIISSELTLSQVTAIDEALGGRIRELSKGYIINIGKDSRKNYRLK